jgi:hypothetical protein
MEGGMREQEASGLQSMGEGSQSKGEKSKEVLWKE